jgi:hypothetical protein
MDLLGFLTPELLTRIVVYPRCIEEYDLDSLLCICIDPRDGPLSGLWTIGYRTHSLPDEGVDESRLTSIWATDDSYISDFRHYGDWVSFLSRVLGIDSFSSSLLLLFFSGALMP